MLPATLYLVCLMGAYPTVLIVAIIVVVVLDIDTNVDTIYEIYKYMLLWKRGRVRVL
jgi:hypothetical protein